MQARLNPCKAAPEAMKAISNLHTYVRRCGLDHQLLELVKLRASQINSCAWCIDMHSKELRAGENPSRGSIFSAPGVNVPSTANASARPSPGRRR